MDNLDKQAVADGYAGGALSHSGTSGRYFSESDLHYASSKQAVAASEGLMDMVSDLHYKKDGTPDMRYTSSKQAVADGYAGGASSHSTASGRGSTGSDLHYKKDDTLDMPQAVALEAARKRSSVDGKAAGAGAGAMRVSPGSHGIPSNVPTKKDGTPDMRTAAAKAWVESQAREHGINAPAWVPRLTDGKINESSPLGKAYKAGIPRASQSSRREDEGEPDYGK